MGNNFDALLKEELSMPQITDDLGSAILPQFTRGLGSTIFQIDSFDAVIAKAYEQHPGLKERIRNMVGVDIEPYIDGNGGSILPHLKGVIEDCGGFDRFLRFREYEMQEERKEEEKRFSNIRYEGLSEYDAGNIAPADLSGGDVPIFSEPRDNIRLVHYDGRSEPLDTKTRSYLFLTEMSNKRPSPVFLKKAVNYGASHGPSGPRNKVTSLGYEAGPMEYDINRLPSKESIGEGLFVPSDVRELVVNSSIEKIYERNEGLRDKVQACLRFDRDTIRSFIDGEEHDFFGLKGIIGEFGGAENFYRALDYEREQDLQLEKNIASLEQKYAKEEASELPAKDPTPVILEKRVEPSFEERLIEHETVKPVSNLFSSLSSDGLSSIINGYEGNEEPIASAYENKKKTGKSLSETLNDMLKTLDSCLEKTTQINDTLDRIGSKKGLNEHSANSGEASGISKIVDEGELDSSVQTHYVSDSNCKEKAKEGIYQRTVSRLKRGIDSAKQSYGGISDGVQSRIKGAKNWLSGVKSRFKGLYSGKEEAHTGSWNLEEQTFKYVKHFVGKYGEGPVVDSFLKYRRGDENIEPDLREAIELLGDRELNLELIKVKDEKEVIPREKRYINQAETTSSAKILKLILGDYRTPDYKPNAKVHAVARG